MTNLLNVESVLFYLVIGCYFSAPLLYFFFLVLKKDGVGKAAALVQALGLLVHTAALVCRGLGAGRLPLTNQYEFAASFAWGLSLVSLIFLWKFKFPMIGAFAAPVILLLLGYAALQSREVKALMPSLNSGWLGIHVSTAIIAYGSFGVSFVLGLIFLLRERMKDRSFWDRHVPSREKLDLIAYRSVCLGLLFLTFTIITGAIWAERAWGSYWSWDPKETWSLVTWLVYATYLHLRIRRGWQGKSAAIFAVAGFVCVIFTYIGVNTLLPGVHSYK